MGRYATVFNQGARRTKGKYLLFMHRDVYIFNEVMPNALEAMHLDERIGIVKVYTNRSK